MPQQAQRKDEINMTQKQNSTSESSVIKQESKAEVFTNINGKVGAGIIFDNNKNMFVARDGELDKVTPDGKVKTLCNFEDLSEGKNYYFNSPLIWDMTFDNQGNILAAAQDRILKITPEGKVSTLIREDFQGFLGASGIECDNQGNFYITNGNKIDMYTPDLKKSTFIDGSKGQVAYETFFSLEFDPNCKNLYVSDFNTKSLLKYQIDSEGKAANNPDIIIVEPVKMAGAFGAPLNITFSEKGNMYVSIDGMAQIMKKDRKEILIFLFWVMKYPTTS